ncbi:hypothetical protein FPQ18DRAFT_76893 [Pyronema domesticum]|uniref:Uncharacterized protein n=1 Tax=Pyronema omphalodes (strain CBS 100304) TaxID=1076935 RepID=U4LND3_PYROM|nr:hypothetical protein FPQ18DRAFT_76893 [Pyronema domesticum]CCX15895.1 Similar to hypothetical protein [Tuber melanosporum Mel28]; acc. no. XP_002838183 [Pyronema omphalodes CBS 100304]
MPPITKTPFCSKNPATIAKSFSSGASSPHNGPQGPQGEVVCPLPNSDGSQCRKKCVGNFAYRSICEHIRRAHPDNWIPKLPASPETFAKMVSMGPRPSSNPTVLSNGMMHHPVAVQQCRKPNILNPQARKSSKPTKSMDEHYIDTLSPPSSADGDNHLPSLSTVAAVAQFAARGFPPYEYQDDEDMDGEHEIDEDHLRGHPETETEDEDYANHYSQNHYNPPYAHIHHHSHAMSYNISAPRPQTKKPKVLKRKRQSTLDSTASTSSTSSFPSTRWEELVEAATTVAVVETFVPPSPPQTAQTLPSICPNTPSGQSVASSSDSEGPKVECNECRSLVGLNHTYVCSECVSGFCEPCATENGKRGVCSECRVFGARWRRSKINIRTSQDI